MSDKVTYHDAKGRFTSKDSAKIATRAGEKLKVVRQLRSLHRKPKPKQESSLDELRRMRLVKERMALSGQLSGPGWIPLSEIVKP